MTPEPRHCAQPHPRLTSFLDRWRASLQPVPMLVPEDATKRRRWQLPAISSVSLLLKAGWFSVEPGGDFLPASTRWRRSHPREKMLRVIQLHERDVSSDLRYNEDGWGFPTGRMSRGRKRLQRRRDYRHEQRVVGTSHKCRDRASCRELAGSSRGRGHE